MDDTREYPGLFLTLEGAHGSGKTTQVKRLADWLSVEGYRVQATREVGGTVLGENLRRLIEDPECASCLVTASKSLLFIVLAARNLHVQQVIRPALSEGKIVICERFEGSTYAIQHYADQLEWDAVRRMHVFASEGLTPDLTILLDIPARLGIARKQNQGVGGFWETRPLEYHERIAQGYRDAACRLPGWIVIDTTRDEDVVFSDLQQRIGPFLSKLVTR
jgi:dTMP kinase